MIEEGHGTPAIPPRVWPGRPASASWSRPSRTPTTRRTPGRTTWSSGPSSWPWRPGGCTRWAARYLGSDHRDALNLYDTSALAHADLVRALRRGRRAPGPEVGVRDLVADLRRQLDSGAGPARREPFGSAVDVTQFDAATRTFGFAATARLYRRLTGDRAYDAFGTASATGLSAPTPGARPS